MKKLIFIFSLLLVVFTIQAQAQVDWYKATTFSMRALPSGLWSEETATFLPVSISSATKRIEIFTEAKQIFDYVTFSTTEFSYGTVYGSYATDSNYGAVYIEIIIYNSKQVYIKITYSDFEYKYKLVSYEQY